MSVPGYSEAQRRARAAAQAAMDGGEGPVEAARAAIAAGDAFFTEIRGLVDLEPQIAAQACAAGCAWCCHQIVAVTVAELELVMDAIRKMPAKARKDVAHGAARAARKGGRLDQRQWWAERIPCPLLDASGLCRVHQSRPLPCRAHNSADAGLCRRSYEGEAVRTPVLAAQQRIWAHAQAGLMECLTQAGQPSQGLNLALALDLRLNSR